MRVTAAQALLLSTFIGVSFRASARPCSDGKCSKRDILPRIEIPGLPIPKIEPKPIVPSFPKPVVGAPNAPGRMPEIAPEPIPVPKPADPKPAAPACKRADGGCVPDHTYTFSGIDYVEKGGRLRDRAMSVLGKDEVRDHNYNTEKGKYFLKVDTHTTFQVGGKEVERFFKRQGIDMGDVLNRDRSWTRYQVHGTTDPNKIRDDPPAVDVYISVKHKAMVPQRLFKDVDALYAMPLEERLPMSEWLFQLWKKAVNHGEADYGVRINVGDLQKIIGKDVDNADAKAIVEKAQKDVYGNAQTFTVKSEDAATFNALSYSSSGISKWNMLYDHNGVAELNSLRPVQVDVSTAESKMPMIAWTFNRS